MTPSSLWQQILDASNRHDPYPLFAELRKTPVARVEDGTYAVSTYREIVSLLHDPRISSDLRNLPAENDAPSAGAPAEAPARLPANLIGLDPPEHDRVRRLLTWSFGPPHCPGRIDGMIPGVLAAVTSEIDDLAGAHPSGASRIDIVDDFAYAVPVTVICRLLGVPREDEPRFRDLSTEIIRGADPSTGPLAERERRRDVSVAELGDYFGQLLDARRGRPGDDLLSGLLAGGAPDPPMSREELLSNAVLLLVAGHETTTNLIANGMLTLLRHPDVLERLRRGDEPGLPARVIEELVRHDPVSQMLANRIALDDIEIAGTTIPRGSTVVLVLASGSRDPGFVEDPDRFDPDRAPNEHLGFGGGIHYCFGAPLARPEGRIALTELARRLENPRLVTDPPPYRSNPSPRGPRHLLVDIDGVRPRAAGSR
ncbi:cytochrome P450 [Streptomyces sp. AV19]|uniref:cytochrome P450 n=1 Tax=Streptomyces sp. AV19 TaxID=2793068 RepID=UPI0018FE5A66|nr:cytochrome P450 [Streptomyces sp. AV19]MBH1938051.1 cytochrome P450 [Streptomyces sp. AV19]MDG4536665.1 cytochrome P450 [Streptomyces sp. AV19]